MTSRLQRIKEMLADGRTLRDCAIRFGVSAANIDQALWVALHPERGDEAEAMLDRLPPPRRPKAPPIPQAKIRAIVRAVSEQTGIPYDQIVQPVKTRVAVAARRWVWKSLRAEKHTFEQIADAWGCNHQTIRAGVIA